MKGDQTNWNVIILEIKMQNYVKYCSELNQGNSEQDTYVKKKKIYGTNIKN